MNALRSNMRQRGGTGRVLLDHECNTLGLEVRTTRGAELVRDLKAISGGERSFVTAAFITALAQCIAAPFYCLDEARAPCMRIIKSGGAAGVSAVRARPLISKSGGTCCPRETKYEM